jgi:copper chaperone CopZ
MTVENAVRGLPGVDRVAVSLEAKTVGIDGDINLDEAKRVIREAGYDIQD